MLLGMCFVPGVPRVEFRSEELPFETERPSNQERHGAKERRDAFLKCNFLTDDNLPRKGKWNSLICLSASNAIITASMRGGRFSELFACLFSLHTFIHSFTRASSRLDSHET